MIGCSLDTLLWSQAAGSYFLLNICCLFLTTVPCSSAVYTRVKINFTLRLLFGDGSVAASIVSITVLIFCNQRSLPHFLPFCASSLSKLLGGLRDPFSQRSLTHQGCQRRCSFCVVGRDSTGRWRKDCPLSPSVQFYFINDVIVLL